MQMTTDEILRDYRAAKSKQNQIGVLADLNCCKARDIVNILLEAGEHVPGNFLPGQKRKKGAAVAAMPMLDTESQYDAVMKLDRAQKPVPMMTRTEYTDVLWWLAYGAGACIAIENEAVRSNIVRCFETAHKLMKELTA